MFGFFKRLFGRKAPEPAIDPDEIIEEQWQADFTRDEPGSTSIRFSITSENLYCAYLSGTGEERALCLGIKKPGCIAWTEDPLFRYRDLILKGRLRIDPRGGYAAAGFIFRMVDDLTYYMVLVSNRGYFRLDLVRNGTPLALAGWTEAPGMTTSAGGEGAEWELELIAYGSRILLSVNGEWAGEWEDPSIPEGRICFAAASYDPGPAGKAFSLPVGEGEFSAEAALLSFSLDSRITAAGERFEVLEDSAPPENRIRLGETFAAMGRARPALTQLRRAWASRTRQGENSHPGKEFVLGAKLALALGLYDEAEGYIEEALNSGDGEKEGRNLMAALLYSQSRYKELIRWAGTIAKTLKKETEAFADPSAFCNLLGHACYNTGKYKRAAAAYDRSLKFDEKNGMVAKNAAAAYELLEEKDKALDHYLKAGRAFLAENRYEELGLVVPKLRLLGETDWEAAALTGKWAFGIEDWKTAEKELSRAERLRLDCHGKPDPAVYFLEALILVRRGKREDALFLFEKAVKHAPDYPLFRFRLAENRLLLNEDPGDPRLEEDMEIALKAGPEEECYGWVHNFAAHAALTRGDAEKARVHLEKASAVLGEVPAVRVNRGVSLYLSGALEDALKILESKPEEDPEGLTANCGGNLLVRSRRFEEADLWYARAMTAAPDNDHYRCNRASCLIELGRYGEADEVLTGGNAAPESNPELLELIAFVATRKGEYKRAEAAVRAVLAAKPDRVQALIHLGWIYAFTGRWKELEETLARLDRPDLNEEAAKSRDELKERLHHTLFCTVICAACGRDWQVQRDPPSVRSLRLYAMPPDDMPAGTCPGCGKSYCVGCRRESLDESGRFVCPDCGKPLKLINQGLKALIYAWAEKNLPKSAK